MQRVHSLTGVLPLGALMVWYLWGLAKVSASYGQLTHAYRAVQALGQRRWLLWPLALALFFHAGYGLLLFRRRPAVAKDPAARAWPQWLQRATALAVLGWLGVQLVAVGAPLAQGAIEPEDAARMTRALFSSTDYGVPWRAYTYLLGLAAATFHLANGLWLAALRWGWLGRRRAGVALLLGALATVAFLAGAHSAVYLATGWRAFEPAHSASAAPTAL